MPDTPGEVRVSLPYFEVVDFEQYPYAERPDDPRYREGSWVNVRHHREDGSVRTTQLSIEAAGGRDQAIEEGIAALQRAHGLTS